MSIRLIDRDIKFYQKETSPIGRGEDQNIFTGTQPSPWSPPTGYLWPGRHSQEITGLLLTNTACHTVGNNLDIDVHRQYVSLYLEKALTSKACQ